MNCKILSYFLAILLFSSCATLFPTRPYSIQDATFHSNNIDFVFTNTAEKDISSILFCIVFENDSFDSEEEREEILSTIQIFSHESTSVSLPICFDEFSSEISNVKSISATKIVYSDGSVFNDPFCIF